MLEVNMRRTAEDLLDEYGQQRFSWPTASSRFPTETEDIPEADITEEGSRDQEKESRRTGLDEERPVEDLWSVKTAEEKLVEMGEMDHLEMVEDGKNRIITSEDAVAETGDGGNGLAGNKVQGLSAMVRRPTMIVPFLPGVGDQLRQIANKHDVHICYTYPGRTADMFNAYRGKLHQSKSRFSVYQTHCSCGTSYMGETSQNLKVRISEHLQKSSKSAISKHLQKRKRRIPTNRTRTFASFKRYSNNSLREKYPQT